MEFEWDPAKEATNLEKHGISFVAAARALEAGPTFEFRSGRFNEARWVAIAAHPATAKVIAVVCTTREGRCRIISARRARKNEEQEYQKHVRRAAPHAGKGPKAGPGHER